MIKYSMETILKRGGLSAMDIEKAREHYDFDKINETIDRARNPKDALQALHDLYPEFDVTALQNEMDAIQTQLEEAMKGSSAGSFELTTEELEVVNGGGITDWFSQNWKHVAIIVAAAVVGGTLGGMGGSVAGAPGAAVGAFGGAFGAGGYAFIMLECGSDK